MNTAIFVIVGAVLVLGILAAVAWEVGIHRRRRVLAAAQQRQLDEQANAQAEAERRSRIRQNPVDWMMARLNQSQADRRALTHAVQQAEERQNAASGREQRLRASFPGGDLPAITMIILSAALAGLWLAAWTTQFLLDLQVALAVVGGSLGLAVLLTIVFTSVLSAASLWMAWLWHRRAGPNPITPRVLRLGTIGVATLFVAAIVLLTGLAPERAAQSYDPQIALAQKQAEVYELQDDETGAAFQRSEVERLTAEKEQSSTVFSIAVVIAGVIEFGSAFFVPTVVQLLLWRRARDAAVAAAADTERAKRDRELANDRFAQVLSAEVEAAGGSQVAVNQFLAQPRAAAIPMPPGPSADGGAEAPHAQRGPASPMPPRPPRGAATSANRPVTTPTDPGFDQL